MSRTSRAAPTTACHVDLRTGIEVEHDAVGPFDLVLPRVPGVDLEDVHLHEPDDAAADSSTRYSPTFVFSWMRTRRELRRSPQLRVLHVDAVARSFATSARASADVRRRAASSRGDLAVVAGDVELRQRAVGYIQAVPGV